MFHRMKDVRRLLWLGVAAALMVSSCSNKEAEAPRPVELTRDRACSVCGMIIMDFPGAKGQIHYRNGKADAFCCTLDMFLFYLQPDRPPHISAIFVNDMGKADPDRPRDHWIDATRAFYVYGGDVMGPMGEALVPFPDRRQAEAYVGRNGGRIVRFDEVTPEMLRPDAKEREMENKN